MPRNLSKTAMMAAVSCSLAEPVSACGPSFGPVGTTLFFGVLALVAAAPTALALAGVVSAVRARRDGLNLGRGIMVALALVCESALARLAGPSSLIGVLAIGLGALQAAFLLMAAVNGPAEAPLQGRLTVLSDQALGALRA